MHRKYNPFLVFAALALALGSTRPVHGQVPLAKQRVVTIGSNQYMLTSKLKKLLIGSFYYNYNHSVATPNLEATLKRVFAAASDSVTVDVSTAGGDITAAKLAGYQVFFANYISSWASATGFPTAGRTAVQNFVETQGGGVFIMHSSGDSRTGGNWPWYYSTAHPTNYIGETSRTNVSAPMFIPAAVKTHPIMEGIGFGTSGTNDTFTVSQGEFHQFAKNITTVMPNASLLLNMNGALCKQNNAGTNCGVATGTYSYSTGYPTGYPAAWTYPDMKGNIGYFMEGHDQITQNAMGSPMWDKFFKQFMYWMAGYDTVQVSGTGVRKSDLDFALNASGVTFHPMEAGVLITRPGYHTVALYDLKGHTLKAMKGSKTPVDYNFSDELKGAKSGVYVVRVAIAGRVLSKRFLLK